jgi:hypothetical protein
MLAREKRHGIGLKHTDMRMLVELGKCGIRSRRMENMKLPPSQRGKEMRGVEPGYRKYPSRYRISAMTRTVPTIPRPPPVPHLEYP